MPYLAADAIHQDPTDPMPVWEKGSLLTDLPAAAVDELLEVAGPTSGSPLVMVEVRLMGGALARQPRVPNAVPGREGAFTLFPIGVLAPGIEEHVPVAGQAVLDRLRRWSTGTALLNWLGSATDPAEVAKAWRPGVYQRLLAVQREFDPDNVFRLGHALDV